MPRFPSIDDQGGFVGGTLTWLQGLISGVQWDEPQSLGSADTLDTLTTPGLYNNASGSTGGLPFSGLFSISVEKVSSAVVQRAVSWNDQTVWVRSITSGTPTAWKQIGGATAEDVAAARWQKTTVISSTTNVDTVNAPGLYQVPNSSTPGLPVTIVGMLEVIPLNLAKVQRYTTWGTSPRVFVRGFATDGSPYAWKEMAYQADVTGLSGRVTALETAPAKRAASSGMKVVPLAMTQPGTPSTSTVADGAVRWCRRYAVMPRRVRVHIANRNVANGTNGDALSLGHIRIGTGSAAGAYTNGTVVHSGGTIPGDGTEFVSPWVEINVPDGEYLNLTVSWWGGGGTKVVQNTQGGGWIASDDANAGEADVTTSGAWTRSQTTPFHCWLEAEVPANTPVVCGQGDSIVIGTSTSDPIGDGFPALYAYGQGALPVYLCQHGSKLTNWTDTSIRWGMYPGVSLNGIVDATVTLLGQNDLTESGITAATLNSRLDTFLTTLKAKTGSPVYLGLVTPSTKATTVEAVRREHNVYRETLPGGSRGVFDFAAAVGDATDEDLAAAFSADGLHPNTAGQQAMADLVTAVPVTPFTPAPSALKALLGA